MLNYKIENIFLDKIDSTQLFAKKNYSTFNNSVITCVFAEEQTKGMGRYNRTWFSSAHENILATFYFSLPHSTKDLTTLGQILCLSVAHILSKHGLKPQIKWPNDLLISDKKICGILSEITFQKNLAHFFLGLGLNVNMEEKNLLLIDQKATSLKEETKKTYDPKKVLEEIEEKFLEDLAIFLKSGFSSFHKKFEELLAYKNKTISMFDGENHYSGTIDSINMHGQLIFKLQDGQKKIFLSGDLTL